MIVLVILAHPQKGSFNHAIAQKVISTLKNNEHDIIFHDLYEEGFNPTLPAAEISIDGKVDKEIKQHCYEISKSDGIVVIHPNWWGQPPAILKGWIDRVLRPGVAYRFIEGDKGEGIPIGLLKAKTAIVFNTSNTSEEREDKVFGDPLERIWGNCIFELCGVENFYRKIFRIIVTSSLKKRKQWLNEVVEIINRYFPKNIDFG